MINIDTRILSDVNESEFWLMMAIAKRFNIKNSSFPSNNTLMKDTGWGKDKLRSIKDSLCSKGILRVSDRFDSNGRQTSNLYSVKTKYLSVFINLSEIQGGGGNSDGGGVGNSDPSAVGNSDGGGVGKSDYKVLTKEELISKVLEDEVLTSSVLGGLKFKKLSSVEIAAITDLFSVAIKSPQQSETLRATAVRLNTTAKILSERGVDSFSTYYSNEERSGMVDTDEKILYRMKRWIGTDKNKTDAYREKTEPLKPIRDFDPNTSMAYYTYEDRNGKLYGQQQVYQEGNSWYKK